MDREFNSHIFLLKKKDNMNKKLKPKIIELRSQGLSYKEISQALNCSKGTVCYHLGNGQVEKNNNRRKLNKNTKNLFNKVEFFNRKIRDKTEDFQRDRVSIDGRTYLSKRDLTFTWQDVVEKFGWETTCYLTGALINLKETNTYHFDHIIPISKGGPSTIDNLGICICIANKAKSDLLKEELIDLCKSILEYNGYKIT